MSAIIEVLRTSADLGIKEIAVNLPEYSEKMIQRELADLVAAGTVRRVGIRRWSKYVLADGSPTPSAPIESIEADPIESPAGSLEDLSEDPLNA